LTFFLFYNPYLDIQPFILLGSNLHRVFVDYPADDPLGMYFIILHRLLPILGKVENIALIK